MGDNRVPEVQRGFRNFQLSEGVGYRASLRGDVSYLVVSAEGKSMFYRSEDLGIGVKLGVNFFTSINEKLPQGRERIDSGVEIPVAITLGIPWRLSDRVVCILSGGLGIVPQRANLVQRGPQWNVLFSADIGAEVITGTNWVIGLDTSVLFDGTASAMQAVLKLGYKL